MEQEWLEVAHIGFDKALIHGRIVDGCDEHGCTKKVAVERWMTAEQMDDLNELRIKHRREELKLLKGFIPQ